METYEDSTNQNPNKSFPKFDISQSLKSAFLGDAFTTFLYGTAVTLVIKADINDSSASLLGLALVLFIFCDWLSRVGLPLRLPPKDLERKQWPLNNIGKSIFEVLGLFFLIGSFTAVLDNNIKEASIFFPDFSLYHCFGFFILCTFSWNILLLYIMEDLSWKDLKKMCFDGQGLDSEKIKHYAKPLVFAYKQLADRNKTKKEEADSPGRILGAGIGALRPLIFISKSRWLVQLFAIHLVWSGCYSGVLLITNGYFEQLSIKIYINDYLIKASTITGNIYFFAVILLLLTKVSHLN